MLEDGLKSNGRDKMLKVPTYVSSCGQKGLGLFSTEIIKKGTIVWELVSGFDIIMTSPQWNKLPEWQRLIFEEHAWLDKGMNLWIYPADDGKYFNHSDDPNCGHLEPGKDIALRDISANEELTVNYTQFDQQGLTFVPV